MPLEPFKNARNRKVLAAIEGNWQAEMEGYYTYLALADRETDAIRAAVLRHLAAAELEHAALWSISPERPPDWTFNVESLEMAESKSRSSCCGGETWTTGTGVWM